MIESDLKVGAPTHETIMVNEGKELSSHHLLFLQSHPHQKEYLCLILFLGEILGSK